MASTTLTTTDNSTTSAPDENTIGPDALKLPETMRAWRYTTISTTLSSALSLSTHAPLPPLPLAPGTYLIRVHSAALNPVDYKLPELPIVGRLAIPKPATPGLDFSGTIVLSTPTSRLAPRTRVFGKLEPKQQFGTLAEYIVGSAEGTVPVPDGLGMEEAAALGVCGLVTYQALSKNVKRGDRVLINGGSGGTGSFAVQIARALGAREVVTTCSGANKQLCKDLGADHAIDYRTENVTEAIEKTQARFDFVLDNVGEPSELYWIAPNFTSPGTKYVQIGSQVSLGFVYDLAFRFVVPKWLGGGQTPFSFAFASTNYKDYLELAKMVAEGKVKPLIDEVFGFEKVPEAYEKLKMGRAKGKIVVRVSEK
ncbi:hypothetical protein E8E13_007586 [Curvularia kusanoi]|uniref:Enoyl reductase (ER) domain-containing protein n=1 Tax=Curvularia kusanoi TaxID=90978 RepID=A0A9P4TEL4_CURKU|nr:hypothetical protein E8E13_007586 [Curvularia kusanoi]